MEVDTSFDLPLPDQGYDPQIADVPLESKFLCSQCKRILKLPKQAYCGHRYCQNCIAHLIDQNNEVNCAECVSEAAESEFSVLQHDQAFPDNAIKRELNKLKVKCINGNCDFRGMFSEYENHLKECKFKPVNCEHCNTTAPESEIQEHYKTCPEMKVTCELCNMEIAARKLMDEHQDPSKNECKPTITGDNAAKLFSRISNLEKAQKDLENKINTTPSNQPTIKAPTPSTSGLNDITISQLTEVNDKLKTSEDIQQVLSDEIESCTQRSTKMETRVKELEKMIEAKNQEIVSLRNDFANFSSVTYNGELIWRITNVRKLHAECASGNTKGIYSPPFYTGLPGYKMCLRVFLAGDGPGSNTHVSVFFVILKGEYDNLLTWPFSHRVTIMLLDQDNREHIIDAFVPTKDDSSFSKPTSFQNKGKGYPLFAPVHYLDSSVYGYIKDDIMFFKVMVDVKGPSA